MDVDAYINKYVDEKVNEWIMTTKNRDKIYSLKKLKNELLEVKTNIQLELHPENFDSNTVKTTHNLKLEKINRFHKAYFKTKGVLVNRKIKKIDRKIYVLSH